MQAPPPDPPAFPRAGPPATAAPQQGCREFDTPVITGGREQQAHGTACLQPDGSWSMSQNVPSQPPQTYAVPPRAYRIKGGRAGAWHEPALP